MKLRFLCVGSSALCEAHSEMQSMSLLRGSGGMPPRKFYALRLNLVLSEHKVAILRTGSESLL